ncbi:MAG: response regulator [Balneolia bacterium]|nr:response regulator [Balneolia bacterium]
MNLNVLIVEDEQITRSIIKQILLDSNLDIGDILEAENGREGLDVLNSQKIDLLLVDIYMPVMDGLEMLEHVMSRPDLKDIPVIVVSTENDDKRVDAIIRKGLGFVHKPFTKVLLKKELAKLGGIDVS